jgi:adenine-specific DNA-methyltransferase
MPEIKKLVLDDPDTKSADIVAGNVDALKALFPEAFEEGKIDFDVLRQLLGGAVDEKDEKYSLNWHGKRKARQIALTPSSGTLLPCPDESVDWDTTQNLMIEGDNLEVLKLLQKSYAGKVKLIYIDPPYNTGTDFVYPDDFQDSIRNYLSLTGQIDEGGHKASSNTESSGRFHTDWLNMMYPRLKLAQRLLAYDGLIVMQISDAELHNLRRLSDEIFGEENYLNTISVKAKVSAGASGGGEDKRLKKNVEYLLVYAKNFDEVDGFATSFVEMPLEDVIQEMKDAGQSWKYTSIVTDYGVRKRIATIPDGGGNPIDIFLHEGVKRASLKEVCKSEGITEKEAYVKYLPQIFSDTNAQTSIRTRVIKATGALKEGQLYSVEYIPTSGREKGQKVCHYYISPTVRRVIWLKDVAYEKDGSVIKRERTGTLWDDIDYNNIGKEGGVAFSNGKKPLELVKRVIDLSSSNDGIVLDFFAGSGTTGHAVLALNAVDSGSRRYVLVQLPEPLDPNVDAQSDAAKFCMDIGKPLRISELTKERLKRSSQLLGQANPMFAGDTGFRVFKLAQSNIVEWEPEPSDLEGTLLANAEHLVPGRTEQDVLYELLLKLGLDLCVPIEKKDIGGKAVHSIGGGTLIVCLSDGLTKDSVETVASGIVAWRKELAPAVDTRVVFKDSGFADDVAKANMAAILNQNGILDVRSL